MRHSLYFRLSAICFATSIIVCMFAISARQASAETKEETKFFVVGVGPGDPDLITLRGLETIKKADVIVCTRTPQTSKHRLGTYFAFEEKFAPYIEDKTLVHTDWFLGRYYGKPSSDFEGDERRKYEEITANRNKVVAELRQALEAGKVVVVLSKGDPLIYGPHAWYLDEFQDVQPVVVPGLSSFNAANAALGRNVTAGKQTRSVILTAGFSSQGNTDSVEELSTHRCTMVAFTMGTEFEEFVSRVSAHYPPDTPIAVVMYAGYADKETVVQGTLNNILSRVNGNDLPFEYLVYVGSFLAGE